MGKDVFGKKWGLTKEDRAKFTADEREQIKWLDTICDNVLARLSPEGTAESTLGFNNAPGKAAEILRAIEAQGIDNSKLVEFCEGMKLLLSVDEGGRFTSVQNLRKFRQGMWNCTDTRINNICSLMF